MLANQSTTRLLFYSSRVPGGQAPHERMQLPFARPRPTMNDGFFVHSPDDAQPSHAALTSLQTPGSNRTEAVAESSIGATCIPVSYTHLTLPTIYSV